MTAVLFDHPVLSAWCGDPATTLAFGLEAELAAILRFETELAAAQADCGVIPQAAADEIAAACRAFRADVQSLGKATGRDGVLIPGLLADLRGTMTPSAAEYLHYGATSQDAIDTGLILRLAPLLGGFSDRLRDIETGLGDLRAAWGDRPLMAVTRMRDALPFRVSDRVTVWLAGVARARTALDELRDTGLAVQLGGPVGTLDKLLGERGALVRARLAERLGLCDPQTSWHVERGRIAALATACAAVTQALGKIGLDMGMMAQDGVAAVVLEGGGSSSMPHKVNPVDAELLVALARSNATLQGGMGQAMLHECERSGAAWTLEWLLLPQMVHATGAALTASARLTRAIRQLGSNGPASGAQSTPGRAGGDR